MAREKEEEEETIAIEPLSPVSRLLSWPELCAVIVITLGFKTRCNILSILEGLKESLVKAPRFSCKLEINKNGGEPVWVPVNTQAENHVIYKDLDNINIENPDEFIEDYCSSIVNIPMDMTKPPWEFHVLNVKTSNAESVGILKLHHSLGDDTENPLSIEPMDRNQARRIIHRIISFDDVKLVKNTMQMTVNDVLLGMTQAGLSRYLTRKYDGNIAEKKKFLERIHLRGTIAANLRPYTKIQDLDNVMTKGAKCIWGNFVGLVIFPLWIKSEDDPLEYVRRAKATMDRKKLSLEALNFYGFIKFTMKVFGEKVVQAITKRLFDHTTLTYSNVMGPDEEISIYDHPISYVAASALTGSQVLNIHYVSYLNNIIISLAVDENVIQDPHRLCDDLVESLNPVKSTALVAT